MSPAVDVQSVNHWTAREVPTARLLREDLSILSTRPSDSDQDGVCSTTMNFPSAIWGRDKKHDDHSRTVSGSPGLTSSVIHPLLPPLFRR